MCAWRSILPHGAKWNEYEGRVKRYCGKRAVFCRVRLALCREEVLPRTWDLHTSYGVVIERPALLFPLPLIFCENQVRQQRRRGGNRFCALNPASTQALLSRPASPSLTLYRVKLGSKRFSFTPCTARYLRAKSRTLPGCAPKRACGHSLFAAAKRERGCPP